MESSAPRRPGDRADLVSQVMRPSQARCMTFWYHMNGPNIGTLRVLVRVGASNITAWTLSGDHGDRWTYAQAPVTANLDYQVSRDRSSSSWVPFFLIYALICSWKGLVRTCLHKGLFSKTDCSGSFFSRLQVVLEGVRGNGPYGDIAVDDIAFTNSKCSGGCLESVCTFIQAVIHMCAYVRASMYVGLYCLPASIV